MKREDAEYMFRAIKSHDALLSAAKAALEHMPLNVSEEHREEMAAVYQKLSAAIASAEPDKAEGGEG